jgi:uncharacterized protein YjbI with pentapeptide repeats
MADQQHIEVLKQGKEVWYRATLIRANLSDANLCGANLAETRLFQVNVSGAELSGTDFSQADWKRDLPTTSFSEAELKAIEERLAPIARMLGIDDETEE